MLISPRETLNEGVVVAESTVGEWGCLEPSYKSNTQSKSVHVGGMVAPRLAADSKLLSDATSFKGMLF